MASKALVLGGGGVTGIAWELGILSGLAAAGFDVTRADLVVGTSAGSVVGAQVLGGASLEELYQRQLTPAGSEIAARMGPGVIAKLAFASIRTRDSRRSGAYIGAMAVAARTMPEAQRREVIASRVDGEWPEPHLKITAVAADNGEFTVFDRESGVSLVDAVGASCAVPGVWPPVTIGSRRYIDGGMRSPANVDLAAGYDRVIVVAPITGGFRRRSTAGAQLAALGPAARTLLIAPDASAKKAIGSNVLDPGRRAPSAEAGRQQALRLVEAVDRVWSD